MKDKIYSHRLRILRNRLRNLPEVFPSTPVTGGLQRLARLGTRLAFHLCTRKFANKETLK
jgi:hypothetical protein